MTPLRRLRPSSTLGILLLAVSAAPAASQVVVDGGTPDGGYLEMSGDLRGADAFEATGPLRFTTIRFWAFLDPLYAPGDIFVEVLADAGGAPGGGIGLSRTVTPEVVDLGIDPLWGLRSYRLDLDVSAALSGGGIYWLALQDVTNPAFTSFWQTSDFWSGAAHQGLNGEWGAMNSSMAFQLLDEGPVTDPTVVPEPGTWVLLLTGLLGIGLLARRRSVAPRSARLVTLLVALPVAACGDGAPAPLSPGLEGPAFQPDDHAAIVAVLDDLAGRVIPTLDPAHAGEVLDALEHLRASLEPGAAGDVGRALRRIERATTVPGAGGDEAAALAIELDAVRLLATRAEALVSPR